VETEFSGEILRFYKKPTCRCCLAARMVVAGAAMRSDDLTPKQADALKAHTRPKLRYLGAMLTRMHKRRFPPQDELLRSTQKAYDALYELNVRLHYLSCSGGVGTPGSKPRKHERRDER
jgi:hypothetical protein